jgi:hypothetical protein
MDQKIIPAPRPGLFIFALLLLISTAHAGPEKERYSVDLEWGAAWQEKNDVQSPNTASGTRFSLSGLTGDGPYSAPRLQLTFPLNYRDDLRLVAAPLRINESGLLTSAVNFQGGNFAAGTASATYRFDSYRATWRRSIYDSAEWILKAGLTAKVRDAEITLRQGTNTASRSDTGFVPLLHFYAQKNLSERSRLIFDLDGLASGRGRAFDLSLRAAHDLRPGLSGFIGLRLLDGGADNDSVYNFARFHYITAGFTFRGL